MPADDEAHRTYTQQFRRCGKAMCHTCAAGKPGHGPYWYAYWREEGRVHSCYLGKRAPSSAELEAAPTTEHPSPVDGPDVLRVHTLGGFQVWRGGAPIPAQYWTRRTVAALFKCLLSAPGLLLHREQLVETLWPSAMPIANAVNLRVSLHLLRKILDGSHGSHIRSEGDWLVLEPAVSAQAPADWLDAATFAQMATAAIAGRNVAACKAALARYTGDYLPDDTYEAWASEQRQTLVALRLALLLHLAEPKAGHGYPRDASRYLQAVLAADPCHEAAARSLMRLLAGGGQRAEAIRVYRRLAEALQRDLELRPERETQALFQALQQDGPPTA